MAFDWDWCLFETVLITKVYRSNIHLPIANTSHLKESWVLYYYLIRWKRPPSHPSTQLHRMTALALRGETNETPSMFQPSQ